jgi:hypothetical protein
MFAALKCVPFVRPPFGRAKGETATGAGVGVGTGAGAGAAAGATTGGAGCGRVTRAETTAGAFEAAAAVRDGRAAFSATFSATFSGAFGARFEDAFLTGERFVSAPLRDDMRREVPSEASEAMRGVAAFRLRCMLGFGGEGFRG